jgi:hypothetical protein
LASFSHSINTDPFNYWIEWDANKFLIFTRDIFKHFSLLPFFRRRLCFFWGEDFEIFCGQHGWRRAGKFWNIEVSRSSEMAFSVKSLDRRKWHFQTLVWPSAGCRAQKERWFRQCIMAISNSVTLLINFWTLYKK